MTLPVTNRLTHPGIALRWATCVVGATSPALHLAAALSAVRFDDTLSSFLRLLSPGSTAFLRLALGLGPSLFRLPLSFTSSLSLSTGRFRRWMGEVGR
jgi:hypothetical protein